MQGFRKYALVVSLTTAIVLGSAATPATDSRHGSLDGSIIERILGFFGILHSRLSTPPG